MLEVPRTPERTAGAEGAAAEPGAATPATPGSPGSPSLGTSSASTRRRQRTCDLLLADARVDKAKLADLTWKGVPPGQSRCVVWQILLGYRPEHCAERDEVALRRRREYLELRARLHEGSAAVARRRAGQDPGRGGLDGEDLLLRQICKDLPRAAARFEDSASAAAAERVVKSPQVQLLMERVLFVWAVQKSTDAYVQGIDGILLMLLLVFLSDRDGVDPERLDVGALERLGPQLEEVEADAYWCMSKVMSLMHDHHNDGFPGIQRMTAALRQLVWRIDERLARHLEREGIDLLESGVRWIGCLMVRELPVGACARLWDALIAEYAQVPEEQGSQCFEELLLYFCVCFLTRHSLDLLKMDFEAIMMFLKRAPSNAVNEDSVDLLLSEAYVLKSLFQGAPGHLRG